MANVNENFLKLKNDYLFSNILEKTNEYKLKNPNSKVINLGIGDVSLPLVPTVIKAMQKAVEEMSKKETFKGYGLVQGYDFLIEKIIKNDYESRKISLDKNEVFIASGTKGDLSGLAELLSTENIVALMDPVYPAYRDTNIMIGRDNIIYLKATEENGFLPQIPNEHVDIIYLCSPNNPTGTVFTKEQLQKWVEYAKKNHAIIFYDSVYESFITDENIPHSIYEIEGAKEVAIEFHSFSKTAGITGVRCGYVVVPKELKLETKSGGLISANELWYRRQCTKFNGCSYVVQRGAEAVYTEAGQKQIQKTLGIYRKNALAILAGVKEVGLRASGGINSPYIWVSVPDGMSSWDFFDFLLREAQVICTPGSGFGPCGEGYVRLTAFNTPEKTAMAVKRLKTAVKKYTNKG